MSAASWSSGYAEGCYQRGLRDGERAERERVTRIIREMVAANQWAYASEVLAALERGGVAV